MPLNKEIKRRLGKPRNNEERRKRHFERFGTKKLPPRGSGLSEEDKIKKLKARF